MSDTFRLSRFDLADRTAFAQATELATAQRSIPVGTPGSIVAEVRDGRTYHYAWRYAADGTRLKQYLGLDSATATDERDDQRQCADNAKKLRRLGYAAADNSTALTLAVLANAGVFAGGAVLVGTHAFAALLNQIGYAVRPLPTTEDVDIARARTVPLGTRLRGGVLDLLRESGLPFIEVPGLSPTAPPVSFKVRGRPLKVDLLVPAGRGPAFREVPVPELGAHAVALPHLEYLLKQTATAVVVGKSHLIPVVVPSPARFAIHKLAVSRLRSGAASPKATKDVWQAAVMVAALFEEGDEEALGEALHETPRTLLRIARAGAKRASELLRTRYAAATNWLDAVADPSAGARNADA